MSLSGILQSIFKRNMIKVKSNLYNVVRKPISQSDYNNALIKLNSLDNTGAGPTIQRERTRRRDIMIRLINSYGRKF